MNKNFIRMDISHLYEDIILHIFHFLQLKDVHSLGLVSKNFQKGYINDLQWKNQLERNYDGKYENIKQVNNYKTYEYCHKLKTLCLQLKLFTPINEIYNIQTLGLRYRSLKLLSKNVGLLTNLETLYLTCNDLESLPTEIKYLTNLQILNLARNRLTSFPKEIEMLTKLRSLDLSNNLSSSLSINMELLTNLSELVLFSDKLKLLPEEIQKIYMLPNIQKNMEYGENGYRIITH